MAVKTPKEIFEAVLAFEHDDEIEALDKMTDDEVAAAIAADGGDPVAIGARGKALADTLIERRKRLQWQVEAREKLDTAATAAAAAGKARPKRSREEMIREIHRAQSEEGFSLAARKGGTDEATDEELEELLMQVEILRGAKGRPPA